MGYLRTCVLVAALLPALAASAGRAASPDEAQACAALTGRHIGGAVIQTATWLPDGGTVGTTRVAQPFCRAIGRITPTGDSRDRLRGLAAAGGRLERQLPRRRLGRQRRRHLARPHA